MSDDYGANFVTLTDDDGNEIVLEFVDSLELNGIQYLAFFPTVEEEDAEDGEDLGLVILKAIQENGEELLSTPDSDEELSMAYDAFMEQLFDDEADEDE